MKNTVEISPPLYAEQRRADNVLAILAEPIILFPIFIVAFF